MACQGSAKPRHELHRGVQPALAAFAKRAGYKTTLEPKTWEIMRWKMSEEQIRHLFPKSKGATPQARGVYEAKLQVLLLAFETRKDAAALIKQAIDDLPVSNPAADGDGKQVLCLDTYLITILLMKSLALRSREMSLVPMPAVLPTKRKNSRMLMLVSLKGLLL